MYGMMSGYTAGIANGSITTGREFLKRCVRNFGCCGQWRDEPLDKPLEELMKIGSDGDWYKERLDEAKAHLEDWQRAVPQERFNLYIQDKLETRQRLEKRLKEMKEARDAYSKVRAEVEAWKPPTEEYAGIKNFALEQIDASCPTEQEIAEAEQDAEKEIFVDDDKFKEWCEGYEQHLKWDVEYYGKKYKEDVGRTDGRYRYLRRFLDSLDDLPVE